MTENGLDYEVFVNGFSTLMDHNIEMDKMLKKLMRISEVGLETTESAEIRMIKRFIKGIQEDTDGFLGALSGCLRQLGRMCCKASGLPCKRKKSRFQMGNLKPTTTATKISKKALRPTGTLKRRSNGLEASWMCIHEEQTQDPSTFTESLNQHTE